MKHPLIDDQLESHRINSEVFDEIRPILADNKRLRVALKNLHDWYVDYARINNLFNGDGSPGTFHELLEARRALALTSQDRQP